MSEQQFTMPSKKSQKKICNTDSKFGNASAFGHKK